MASTLPRLPVFEAISRHDPTSIGVLHSASGRKFSYGELLQDVADTRARLRSDAGPLEGQRVAFLVENSYDYIVTFLSILGNNSIALPLCPSFPTSELRYILNDSRSTLLLASEKFREKAEEIVEDGLDQTPLLQCLEKRLGGRNEVAPVNLQGLGTGQGGMMLYTSGTTNRPKGVLLPESVLTAQVYSLLEAWKYTPDDHLLHLLPLHHIHGTVNALLAPLFAGSSIEFMFPFNAHVVWERLAAPFLAASGVQAKPRVTFLTAVPTIYNRLLNSHSSLSLEIQAAAQRAISPHNLRLNISGSAALPTTTKSAWTNLSSGNVLLERYGMTEVGMALSCGLAFKDRVDGSVGWPLPSVQVRLVETESGQIIKPGEELDSCGKDREGEIQLRGPTIFREYWRNEKATLEEFDDSSDCGGKWFKTGDIAVRKLVDGAGKGNQIWAQGPMYFIRGRKSVDIIKTGGEKVSALEVERELLSLPQVAEVAVVGLPSDQWGQKVAAIVVLHAGQVQTGRGGKTWSAMDMRRALKDKLANYKIPQELKVLQDGLPRNAMGKVNKKQLIKEVFGDNPT